MCDGARRARPAVGPRPQAARRRRPRPEHRRDGRLLAAGRPARRGRRATSSTGSTGRSWPSWPGAARRSAAPCTPGLMLTADGPVLLECNARFGDPETQAILPRLAVPLGPLLLAAARGRLPTRRGRSGRRRALPTLPGAAVGGRAGRGRLPGAPAPRRRDRRARRGARHAGALVFHAGTRATTTAGSDRRRPRPHGRRARARTSPRRATRAEAAADAHRVAGAAAPPRHRRRRARAAVAGAAR